MKKESIIDDVIDSTIEDEKNIVKEKKKKVYSIGEEAREIIERQPKKTIFFPLKQGEREGSTQRVSINDYIIDVPKGIEVEVPESVYELLRNRMLTEGLIAKNMLVDRNDEVRNNLS